jgi:anti-sigma factor RsiW
MSQCETVQQSIGPWLDGELKVTDGEMVRRHVEGCPECGAEHRRLEKIHATFADILSKESSQIEFAPFWREVRRRIDETQPWYQGLIEWARSISTSPRSAWAVPAAIVLVLGFLSLTKWPVGGQVNNYASVESIDTHGRNVALLREDETKTTIIWLYQDSEGENENVDETTNSGPAF